MTLSKNSDNVVARKNFMFCKNANGVKVEEYLKYTIENIDKLPLEKLLPWHKDLPYELRIHPEDIK